MKAPNTSIPPLYRYNLSKLPLDIFVHLTNPATGMTASTTTSNEDYAQKLQYDIVYQLKHASMSGLRRGISAPTFHTTPTASNTNTNGHYNDDDRITTVAKLLQLSPSGLFHRLDPLLTSSECIRLYQRICIHCAPNCKTAYTLISSTITPSEATGNEIHQPAKRPRRNDKNSQRYVATGWDTLDQKLRGGLRIGTITELMGAAGTGKTQLALQTTITTALHQYSDYHYHAAKENDPGTRNRTYIGGGGTIWIDTEQKLSLLRLQEMTMARCPSIHPQHNSEEVATVLENVIIHSPSNMNEFIHVLDSVEKEIFDRNIAFAAASASHGGNRNTAGSTTATSNHPRRTRKLPVRLLVIDSIAASVGRALTHATTAPQQAIGMMQIAQLLKRYADQYAIAILIINQVTSTSTFHSSTMSIPTNYPQQYQRAALGTAWHHCITTRIELQQYDTLDHDNHYHHNTTNGNKANGSSDITTVAKHHVPHRNAKIVKSLTVEPSHTPLLFQITTHGIVDCRS